MIDDTPLDDFLQALHLSVKREVVENYLHERRLIEVQVEDIDCQARELVDLERRLALRYRRLYVLMIEDCHLEDLIRVLGLPRAPYRDQPPDRPRVFKFKAMRFLTTRGLSVRGRYVRLVFKAYQRLHAYNQTYAADYRELQLETAAVNQNIARFRTGFDVLGIMTFLRNMDVSQIQRARFLGGNFRPDEVNAIEKRMYFPDISLKKYNFEPPADLPEPPAVKESLQALAEQIHRADPEACRLIVLPNKAADQTAQK
ncbi:MAG: hypothetical protein KJ621_12555 [Proteobacteria bacterium]|nr:hypothetical protein [Pseudomonadota bacterium]MBU1742019.1 hypothetical protein [Pseudomonadota bacterium]